MTDRTDNRSNVKPIYLTHDKQHKQQNAFIMREIGLKAALKSYTNRKVKLANVRNVDSGGIDKTDDQENCGKKKARRLCTEQAQGYDDSWPAPSPVTDRTTTERGRWWGAAD